MLLTSYSLQHSWAWASTPGLEHDAQGGIKKIRVGFMETLLAGLWNISGLGQGPLGWTRLSKGMNRNPSDWLGSAPGCPLGLPGPRQALDPGPWPNDKHIIASESLYTRTLTKHSLTRTKDKTYVK